MLINKSKGFIAILMSQKVIFLEKKGKDDSYCSTCIYLNAMEFLYVIKHMLKLVYKIFRKISLRNFMCYNILFKFTIIKFTCS